MKVEGTKKELENLFNKKPSKFDNWFWKNRTRKKMNKKTKNIIIFSAIFVGVVMLFIFAVQMYYDTSDNYVTTYECSRQITSSVFNAENLTWQNQLIFAIKPLIEFLLICLGISWVVHGVGFRIIR